MFKKIFLILIFVVSPFAQSAMGAWTGNVNFLLGSKSLEESDWAPVEEQGEFGVMLDFKEQSWPVSIAIDMLGSGDEETISGFKFEGTTSEFDLGARKIFEIENSNIRPFIGGGLALISAEAKLSYSGIPIGSASDSGAGLWLNGGVYWSINDQFNLGVQLRTSTAEVTFNGYDIQAGGGHAGVMLGFHW